MPCLRLALPLIALALVVAAGCAPAEKPGPPSPPFPSVVDPVPDTPVVADKGLPGRWERLDGVEPPARAFVVAPDGTARGGVVLVPSIWGTTREVRDLARRIAEKGWLVAVPDLYEGVVATSRISMKELLAGVSAARAQSLIVATRARLESDLGEAPLALVALGRGAVWALGQGVPLAGYRAAAFDTAPLDDGKIEEFAAAHLPVLVLFGDNSSLYPLERRIELGDGAARAGATLVIFPVPGAGSELFDPKGAGFSEYAYGEALARLLSFLDETLS